MKKILIPIIPMILVGFSACNSNSSPTPPTLAQPGSVSGQCGDSALGSSVRDLGQDLDATGLRYWVADAPQGGPQGHEMDSDKQGPDHHPGQPPQNPGQNQPPRDIQDISKDPRGEQLSQVVREAARAICTGNLQDEANAIPKIQSIIDYLQSSDTDTAMANDLSQLEQIQDQLTENVNAI